MSKENSIPLQEAIEGLRRFWLHRGDETVKAALDTIDALYRNDDLKPLPVKIHRSKDKASRTLILNLPPGSSYRDIKSKEHYFTDATGGAVDIQKRGKAVFMTIMTDEIKSHYPYSWDPAPYAKLSLPIPIGYSATGFIVRDLAGAPNWLSAGHPGSGKSNFLHNVVISLLLSRPVLLAIIDLKKLEFDYLKDYALVVDSVKDAQAVLAAINKQLDRRAEILRKAKAVKIQEYSGEMPFIVLVIDELAEMQDDTCQDLLNRIVRLGRAPGICVVAATQRPSSTMFKKFGDSKAMFAANVCFHVRDEVNSRMILDNDRAALIPNIPGRGIFQHDKELEVQAMYLPISKAQELLRGIEPSKGVTLIEPHQKRLPAR